MNIWKWLLFYIYSGIALGALCSKGVQLTLHGDEPDEVRERIIKNRDAVIMAAQSIGMLFADSTTMTLIGNVQNDTINAYKQALANNEAALKAAATANTKGA